MNKLETQDVCDSSQRHVETSNPHVKVPHETATMDKGKQVAHDASVASLSVQQLQDMIANSVRAQYSAPNQDGFTYSKPYARRIDNMRMPTNYTPPKLQLFDGKGDPRQHIAHFIETCNEAGTYGDLLVKQFVRSLKGNAFEWYTGLDSESIDSWEQMENEFYNRFYSTKRTVSMMELTNTKQLKDEPVIDYINRWRSLSLDCKDRLSEISAVEMCMQGMHWGLLYILQGIKPHSFKELATRAHDMELSIASRGEKNPPIIDQRRERKDGRRTDKFPKPIVKDAMTINTAPVKISGRENKKKETRIPDSTRGREKPRLTLKELEEKEYPFPDSDVAGMLEDLLEKKVIQLPECKRPEEMGRVQDPKYCKFHRIVSHPVEKCFVLKELILNLARQNKIQLDFEDMVESNHATITFGSFDSVELRSPQKMTSSMLQRPKEALKAIQFGTIRSVEVEVLSQNRFENSNVNQGSDVEEEDGWTLVTRKRSQKQHIPRLQMIPSKRGWQNHHERISRQGTRKNAKQASKKVWRPIKDDKIFEQRPRTQVTLQEYFPKVFFEKGTTETTHLVSCYAVESGEAAESKEETQVEESNDVEDTDDVLTQLKDLPQCTGVEGVFQLPKATQIALIQLLQSQKDVQENGGLEDCEP